jgi:uncharacterized protein (DUF1800 family)
VIRVKAALFWGARVCGVVMGLAAASGAAVASAQGGTLSALTVANLSPAFDPAIKNYTIPKTSACSVTVTATLTDPTHKLYISGALTTSGTPRSAWVCDGRTKIDIVIYKVWTEVGRYTVTPTVPSTPPPPPPPPPPTLSALVLDGLMPAFSPTTTEYTIQRPAGCSVTVTATLANPAEHRLYIASGETPSGTPRQAWICDGRTKVEITIYKVWTEVGKYTVTVIGDMPPPPPPAPPAPPAPPPPPATEPVPSPSPAPVLPNEPLPAPSPVSVLEAKRFLSQASFGPNAAEMANVQANGIQYWLVEQFKKPESTYPDGQNSNLVRSQMFMNFANGQDQLRQRMIFALSQTLVVSGNKLTNGEELTPWLRMLSTHAFGNYRTLLREVTISPSMGKFLDLANSIGANGKSGANENYPRELMQLFSIGIWQLNPNGTIKTDAQGLPIPSYDQNTVKEVARALTGWTYPTWPGATPQSVNSNPYFVGLMEPRPQNHDAGAKTIFGTTIPANQTVTKDMEDVVDIIFNHPNVAPFVATRLIRSLVTSNPSGAYIQRVANVFNNDGTGVRGNLAAVLKAVLLDPDASLPLAIDGHLKDHVLAVISFGRALGAQFGDPNYFNYIMTILGQFVLTPPSVFSYYSPLAPMPGNPTLFGPEFSIYPPAIAVQRANLLYGLLTNQFGPSFQVNLSAFTALAGDPAALVELVNQKLLFGSMSNELRAVVLATTQATSDANQRVIGAIFLTALSSEFNVFVQ